MSEFSVQSEGVDVERIMEQIRARIRTDREDEAAAAQAGEQAGARAAQLADPGGARAALAARPRPAKAEPAPRPAESFEFDQDTIYRSSRGAIGSLLYGIRRLLGPLLKFFFNVTPVTHALAVQSRINAQQAAFDDRVARLFDASSARLEAREEIDKLNYRVMLDLVAEMTRLSAEMKNHRMLVESVAARLDFFERQARARETGVQARSGSQPADQTAAGEGRTDGTEPARRRRRRGRRRSGRSGAASEAAAEAAGSAAPEPAEGAAGRRTRSGGQRARSRIAASRRPVRSARSNPATTGRRGRGGSSRRGCDGNGWRDGRGSPGRHRNGGGQRARDDSPGRRRNGAGDRRRGAIGTTKTRPRAGKLAARGRNEEGDGEHGCSRPQAAHGAARRRGAGQRGPR